MTEGEGSVASVGGHCACALRLSALCSHVRLLVAVISQCSATVVDISFSFFIFPFVSVLVYWEPAPPCPEVHPR